MEAINEYFRNLYWINEDKLDKGKILEKLSEEVGSINFPFREITEDFKIIDKDMESVIIPYNDDAKRIIKQLRYAEFTKKLARKAQRLSLIHISISPSPHPVPDNIIPLRSPEKYSSLFLSLIHI